MDIIGGWLTEVNVTSPAGFRTLERLYGVRAEDRLVDWIEQAALRDRRYGRQNDAAGRIGTATSRVTAAITGARPQGTSVAVGA